MSRRRVETFVLWLLIGIGDTDRRPPSPGTGLCIQSLAPSMFSVVGSTAESGMLTINPFVVVVLRENLNESRSLLTLSPHNWFVAF